MKKLFLILAVVAMTFGTAVAQNAPATTEETKPATEQKVEEDKYPLLSAEDKAMAEELYKAQVAVADDAEMLEAAKAEVAKYTNTFVKLDPKTKKPVKDAKTKKQVVDADKVAQFNNYIAELEAKAKDANSKSNLQGAEEKSNPVIKKFVEGGWEFMLPILLVLILGMAIAIERILFLTLSTINTKKFIAEVEQALAEGGIEAAKEVCRNTRGPIASIYYQGLDRYHQGLDAVEKSVVSYGSVQTGQMESGLGWLSLFISLAPSLGFLGTVWGLIVAFDKIEAEKNISPDNVAGGMKIALLTTLFGLVVAMILQVLYNFIIVKIDNMVNDMEDASITLTDILTAYEKK
jgi:biopolymer transport protein ExbB